MIAHILDLIVADVVEYWLVSYDDDFSEHDISRRYGARRDGAGHSSLPCISGEGGARSQSPTDAHSDTKIPLARVGRKSGDQGCGTGFRVVLWWSAQE